MPDGAPLRVYEHETELVAGFEAMYRFLVRERHALLTPDSPFNRFRDVPVRFVYRHTGVYLALLDRLTMPRRVAP